MARGGNDIPAWLAEFAEDDGRDAMGDQIADALRPADPRDDSVHADAMATADLANALAGMPAVGSQSLDGRGRARMRADIARRGVTVAEDVVHDWHVRTIACDGIWVTMIDHPYALLPEGGLVGAVLSQRPSEPLAMGAHAEACAFADCLPHADAVADDLMPGWFEAMLRREIPELGD